LFIGASLEAWVLYFNTVAKYNIRLLLLIIFPFDAVAGDLAEHRKAVLYAPPFHVYHGISDHLRMKEIAVRKIFGAQGKRPYGYDGSPIAISCL